MSSHFDSRNLSSSASFSVFVETGAFGTEAAASAYESVVDFCAELPPAESLLGKRSN